MKKNYLKLIGQAFFILMISACAHLKKNTTMVEKFNFEAVEGRTTGIVVQNGEWLIDIGSVIFMTQWEYAPARDFYIIVKEYHPNGLIDSYCKFVGNVAFGERRFYDEKGVLTKVINEDAKFGKIKPHHFVEILEKIGWINRKTGENVITKKPLETDGHFTMELQRVIKINFSPAEYDKNGKETKSPVWSASYSILPISHHCIVNGNTGEYELSENFYQNEK